MVLICLLLSYRKSCIPSYYLKMFIQVFHCIWTIININWHFEKLPAPSIFAWWYQAQIYCCTNIVKDKTSKLKKIQRAGSWFFFFLQILHTNRQWNLPIKQFCSRYALTNSNTLPQCQIARNPCRHLTICVALKNCWHWSSGETAKGTKKNDILRETFSNFVARKQKLERTHIAVNKSSSNVMVLWYFTYVPRFLELDFHSFHDSCMLIGFLTFSGGIEMWHWTKIG